MSPGLGAIDDLEVVVLTWFLVANEKYGGLWLFYKEVLKGKKMKSQRTFQHRCGDFFSRGKDIEFPQSIRTSFNLKVLIYDSVELTH